MQSSLRIRAPSRRPAHDRGPAPPRRGARRQAARVARSGHRGPRARGPGDRRAVHLPRGRLRRDPPRLRAELPPPFALVPDHDPAMSRGPTPPRHRGEKKAPGLPYTTARFPARFDVCQRRAVPGSPPDASAPHPMPRGELRDRPSPTNPTDVACPAARRLHVPGWIRMALGPGVEVDDRQAPGASPAEGAGDQPRCGPGAGMKYRLLPSAGRTDPGRRRRSIPGASTATKTLRWSRTGSKSARIRKSGGRCRSISSRPPRSAGSSTSGAASSSCSHSALAERPATGTTPSPSNGSTWSRSSSRTPSRCGNGAACWRSRPARRSPTGGTTTRSARSRPVWPSAAMSVGDPS